MNTENPQKVFMCHAYQCGFRGNLLTLMHGWLTGSRPAGNKLTGDEFHRVKNLLASDAAVPTKTDRVAPIAADDSPPPFSTRNVPLAESDDPKIRPGRIRRANHRLGQALEGRVPASPGSKTAER